MDLTRPYSSVCPSLDGDVLRVLAATTLGLTGRQVALLTGRTSHSGVIKVLDRLVKQGLVDRVELNRTYLFSLNRDHLAASAVESLMELRSKLIDQTRSVAAAWTVQPVHLSMFGSAARGDGNSESDIDLFAVRAAVVPDDDGAWREQVEDLGRRVERWTGNPATVMEVSEAALGRFAAEGRPILSELRADGVLLAGRDVGALLESD
jgi:hypothetical protein